MKSKKALLYWVCVNSKRYVGCETFSDAQFLIRYFKASGCTEQLEIEAEVQTNEK